MWSRLIGSFLVFFTFNYCHSEEATSQVVEPPKQIEQTTEPTAPTKTEVVQDEEEEVDEVIIRKKPKKKRRVRYVEIEEEPELEKEASNFFKIGLTVFYNLADRLESTGSITTQGTTLTFNGHEDTEAALGVGLSLIQSFNDKFGAEYGVQYETERTISSGTINANGVQIAANYTGQKPKFKILSAFANGRFYANENVYLLGGVSIANIDISNSELSVSTAYGGQAGLGFQINDEFSLEAQYKMIATKASDAGVLINGNSYTAEFGRMELSGMNVLFKYQF